eukprot:scaffold4890_cov242-Prasinococcus_capsulatus_cf.AAC.1
MHACSGSGSGVDGARARARVRAAGLVVRLREAPAAVLAHRRLLLGGPVLRQPQPTALSADPPAALGRPPARAHARMHARTRLMYSTGWPRAGSSPPWHSATRPATRITGASATSSIGDFTPGVGVIHLAVCEASPSPAAASRFRSERQQRLSAGAGEARRGVAARGGEGPVSGVRTRAQAA